MNPIIWLVLYIVLLVVLYIYVRPLAKKHLSDKTRMYIRMFANYGMVFLAGIIVGIIIS